MNQDDKIEIDEILNGVICPKENKCHKSKFDDLCKAEDVLKIEIENQKNKKPLLV